jgi:hypothetical protein
MTTNKTQINTQKRTFLKTLLFSLTFLSFGGIGSILSAILFEKPENNSKSGFGSNGYGL